MERLASTGQKVGYLLLLVAIAGFVWGAVAGFPSAATTLITVCLALTTVILAPAIVLGYAVRAAEREDREAGR
jgi:multisubunit Na+/H+ antiporter MnhG subunit